MIFVIGLLVYVLVLCPIGMALLRTAARADAAVMRQERRTGRPLRMAVDR